MKYLINAKDMVRELKDKGVVVAYLLLKFVLMTPSKSYLLLYQITIYHQDIMKILFLRLA